MNTIQTAAKLQLAPYIFFYGRCEEALEFYKTAIGGTYELQRNSEAPPDMPSPSPEFRDKVMHSTFTGAGITFMASDGREAKKIDPDAGNISLSLAATDAAEGDRVFKALSDGGKVVHPLSEAFWGGRFGMLTDPFGNEWMIVSP
ncbi:MAG: VOC family protein [Candidatus Elarobacter sp.]